MADKQWCNSVVDQVGNRLRERILRQGLRPGDRLPSYRQLAREFDVAYMTVKRGMDALVEDRAVERVPSKGLFVAEGMFRRPQALGNVLILFPTSLHFVLSHTFTSEMSRGFLAALESAAIASQIRSLVVDGLVFGDYVDRLGVDAVVLPGMENDEYLKMVANWGYPAVVLDYCSEALPMDFVACDNRAATRHCVEHLARLGHRRIAYQGDREVWTARLRKSDKEPLTHRSSDARERREGILAAAAACGLPEPRLLQTAGEDSTKLATKLVTKFSEDPSGTIANQQAPPSEASLEQVFRTGAGRPTALVLDSDLSAPDAIRRLAELGLRVPQDVSVCAVAGAGDPQASTNLAYCKFDFYGMGRKAVEILRERFARPEKPVNRIHRIGFEWVEGGSTREARA